MPHSSPSPRSLARASAALAHGLVILAALALGLLECLALARCRWQDRRRQRLATAD